MNALRIVSLQSGSNGNSYFVESGNIRFLIDSGITASRTVERLTHAGIDIASVQGILISHAHSDHISGAGVLHRRYKIPVWLTQGAYHQVSTSPNIAKKLGKLQEPHLFHAGESLQFDGVTIETISTPHDALDSVCFVFDDGQVRLGIITDLGCRFLGLGEIVETLDAILLESNYDEKMLETGMYPEELKQRIRSNTGHLSNIESAKLIQQHGKHLRWACLGHLSEHNNTPEKTLDTHQKMIGNNLDIFIASRYQCTELPALYH
ncbi:MAG: MBL fold metallo-hydrolase [Planctomycetaceae bacterium]|jgi:phosphoribosyl 1,2-cyclic phosphodiesterase|nr:MBL fold metallo-hydrolase [Planctomycetaceae bacterium]